MRILAYSLIIGLLGISSCAQQSEKARNGLEYSVIREGGEKTSNNGDYLVLRMSYKEKATDSVWYDTSSAMPQLIQNADSVWTTNDKMIQVIFAEMNEGDSVTFDVSAADLFKYTFQQPMPPQVDSTAILQFNVGLDKILNEAELMPWYQAAMDKERVRAEAMSQEQFEKDVTTISEYLAANNIEAEKTDEGIFIETIKEGEGELAKAGDNVSVDYVGYLMTGEHFDTSKEEVAKEQNIFNPNRPAYEPYSFVLGQNAVIQGWDLGLQHLKEGGQARFYIPSTLGYGPSGSGAVIKPNSILIFDIDLTKVN